MLPLPSFLALLLLSLLSQACADTTVTPNWSNRTFTSKTTPTLQMVLNPLVSRASPIHDELYRTLRAIRPRYARYQAWFPYPRMAVPEIDPPSGLSQCRNVAAGYNATLSCARGGGVIDTVEFASFGLPTGACRSLVANASCSAPASLDAVTKLCVGQANCTVPADTALFGSPCPGHEADYRLAVQVTCDPPQNNTYWDFSYFDPVVVDFLDAVGPEPSLDLSTTPAWMWEQGTGPLHHYPDNALQVDWNYNTGDRLVDPTCEQVGQYYGRIAAWFTQGGFTDEYGDFHRSPHRYKLSLWELLNEMEHGLDVVRYTCIYDQAVKYVKLWADPDNTMQFVGSVHRSSDTSSPSTPSAMLLISVCCCLCACVRVFRLAEEDPTLYDDYTYFLNASNHLPGTPIDWISYHRYAIPSSRTNVSDYEQIFENYDEFFDIVRRIEAIRIALAPSVRTTIDEAGVILPGDNDMPPSPAFPLVYWNACAAGFAYLFARLSVIGVDVVGSSQVSYTQLLRARVAQHSPTLASTAHTRPSLLSCLCACQLMGYPRLDDVLGGLDPQYSSVSMVNWTTGAGTARVRVLELLIHQLPVGSELIETAQDSATDVFAQAYLVNGTAHVVLLLNKRTAAQQVTLIGASGGERWTIDEQSGERPPRREKLSGDSFEMAPFAVSLVHLPATASASAGRFTSEDVRTAAV